MMSLSGRLTVPQIFFNEKWIGGSDDLMTLLDKWDTLEEDASNSDPALNPPPCDGESGELSLLILKNANIWRVYQEQIASQPDPADPRLALPAPLVVKREPHGSSNNLLGMMDENKLSEDYGEEADFGCVNLPDGTCASIREVTNDLVEHMPRQKLAYRAKFYSDCFQGNEGVDALLKIYPFERGCDAADDKEKVRTKAVEFGRTLQQYGILHHVVDQVNMPCRKENESVC